jgi:hypothetical protein
VYGFGPSFIAFGTVEGTLTGSTLTFTISGASAADPRACQGYGASGSGTASARRIDATYSGSQTCVLGGLRDGRLTLTKQ